MNESKNDLIFKQNREISWLRFNERVLEEANDPEVPIFERLNFLAIFNSNLDEFFMIRVGSLYDLSIYNPSQIDNKSGLTPSEQLSLIYKHVITMTRDYDCTFFKVENELRQNGIYSLEYSELDQGERKFIKKYFYDTIAPILSPQIVDPHHPFPHLQNNRIFIAVRLRTKEKSIFGLIPVPENLPNIVFIPGLAIRYINIEKIIEYYTDKVFSMYEVVEKLYLSVTRNADISLSNDNDDIDIEAGIENEADYRQKMKKLLEKRKRLAVVRLKVSKGLSKTFKDYLCNKLEISEEKIYVVKAPHRLDHVKLIFDRYENSKRSHMVYKAFMPVNTTRIAKKGELMKEVFRKDVLFHYPYESMQPFLKLIKEASVDKNVISIKITIYRLAKKAALVDYLCIAAENGIDVTVVIELRARFDEQNNIDWSQKLEKSGCRIIFGFEDFKVHSKICLITYRDMGRIKFLTQIGTGNYNENTAEHYTDLSLITAHQGIGNDAIEFFNNISIGNLNGEYKHFMVAPNDLKKNIIELIEQETLKKEEGRIIIKVNSITEIDIINKLSEASIAGVKIDLIVRGICCILPKISGKTENITITSIVGRFLEHSRIYSFGENEDQKLFIASADLMTRNLDRRIELACPIYSSELKIRINGILETLLYDNVKSRLMTSDGSYKKKDDNRIPIHAQQIFMNEAVLSEIHVFKEPMEILPDFRTKLREIIKIIKTKNN